MFLTKIFCTLLLIQSFQLTFAQDEDDLGLDALPRFEARRQSALTGRADFEYDDEDARGKTNPAPARSGRNDDNNEDDYDENQAPQNENSGSSAPASGTKGAPAPTSGSGRLGLPRFPTVRGQPANSFIAPLPVAPVAPVAVGALPAPQQPVSISASGAPVTVVGKTNLGSSGALAGDRTFIPFRPNDPTKTVRVVKTTRVVRPGPTPVAVDQSDALSGLSGGVKSSQGVPTVTRVVRPVLVQQQQQPAFVAPLRPVGPSGSVQLRPVGPSFAQVQPVGPSPFGPFQSVGPSSLAQSQPVGPSPFGPFQSAGPSASGQLRPVGPSFAQIQPVGPSPFGPFQSVGPSSLAQSQPVGPSPLGPVSIATPITSSGLVGPNTIVSGGVKTVPISGNSRIQPPRLRVTPTQRPTTSALDEDDEDDSASASSGPSRGQPSGVKTVSNPLVRAPTAPLTPVQRFAPTRPQIRQPARLEVIYADEKLPGQDEDDFDGNSGNSLGLPQPDIGRINRFSGRNPPQPYLVPLPSRSFQPATGGVLIPSQLGSNADVNPTVLGGKGGGIQSSFNVRPQPVSVPQSGRPTILTPVAPAPIQSNPSPIIIGSGLGGLGPQSVSTIKGTGSVSPSRFQPRPITTQRPAPTVNFVDEDGDEDDGLGSNSQTGAQPVPIRTTGSGSFGPSGQINSGALPGSSQSVFNPQPTAQPIVQIRDGALPADLPLPAPPRPVQIVQRVRNTPAPTIRPLSQVSQLRESALPSVQPVQISQPRLVPVAPQQQINAFQPARPLSQVSQIRDGDLPAFQPLDPSLRPSIPSQDGQDSQVRDGGAPVVSRIRQPVGPQGSQGSQGSQGNQINPSGQTFQVREPATPFTSQGAGLGFGGPQISQPRPVEILQPAPQPFEILRLREPSFPRFTFDPTRPQPVVPTRSRLVPATLPSPSSIPTSRPTVQISQEKDTSLSQPAAPGQVNFIQQQQPQSQSQLRRFPSGQGQNAFGTISGPFAPLAPISPVISDSRPISQPRPIIRQPSVPRVVAPLPLQPINPVAPGAQPFGFPITGPVPNRIGTVQISQPDGSVVTVQQPRPTIIVNRPQPAQVIVSNRRPINTIPSRDSVSSGEQVVQIRDNAASVPDEISQIQQVRLARA